MRRKFTVYGLRFSKTSFWNRINTGFLDPAVATAPTACGIETSVLFGQILHLVVATAPTACGIETVVRTRVGTIYSRLQQHLPLAVLKPLSPLALVTLPNLVATAPTACGIETVYLP